jgi:hypothetical protein
VFEHVVLVGGFHQFMGVVTGPPAGHILVVVVGADEAGALVAGGNPLDEVQARQVKPAVVVPVDVLLHEVYGAADIGGLAEDHEEILIAALFHIATQDGELPALFASLRVTNDHPRLGAPVRAGIVGREVGAIDDRIGVGQRIGAGGSVEPQHRPADSGH